MGRVCFEGRPWEEPRGQTRICASCGSAPGARARAENGGMGRWSKNKNNNNNPDHTIQRRQVPIILLVALLASSIPLVSSSIHPCIHTH